MVNDDLPTIVALEPWSFDLVRGVVGCGWCRVAGQFCGLFRLVCCRPSELLSVAGRIVSQIGGAVTNFIGLVAGGAVAGQLHFSMTRTPERCSPRGGAGRAGSRFSCLCHIRFGSTVQPNQLQVSAGRAPFALYLAALLAVLDVDFRACATSVLAAFAVTEAFSWPAVKKSTNQLVP